MGYIHFVTVQFVTKFITSKSPWYNFPFGRFVLNIYFISFNHEFKCSARGNLFASPSRLRNNDLINENGQCIGVQAPSGTESRCKMDKLQGREIVNTLGGQSYLNNQNKPAGNITLYGVEVMLKL